MALQADNEHVVRPGMVYISMTTEVGTIYSKAELTALYATCKELALPLYIDGARLASALTCDCCDLSPEEMAALCDVFTVGGTKGGALFGEAIVFTNPSLGKRFRYFMKRHGGMLAKGRLLGVQFEALLQDDLYFTLGRQSNRHAMAIRAALEAKGLELTVDSPSNQQFVKLHPAQRAKLEQDFVLEFNAPLQDGCSEMRICTSWATTEEQVQKLIAAIAAL